MSRQVTIETQGRVAMANFEKIFSDFVESFGGKVLPPSNNAKCADYLFDADHVIAELKTLSVNHPSLFGKFDENQNAGS